MSSLIARRIFLLAIVFLAFAVSSSFAVNPASSGGKVELLSGSDTWDYYSFDKSSPLEYNLVGGKRYKFIVRGKRVPGEKVEIKSFLDGKPLKTYAFSKNLSRKTKLKSNGQNVTMGYVIYFKVPKGEHKLKISAENELIGRLLRESAERVSITPLDYADDDYLIVGDDEYEYYFTSHQEPAVFELYGPLDVTIFSRLSYFPEIHGVQHYSVFAEDNGIKKTLNFETDASSTGVYKTHRNIIPGKAEKYKLKLEEGKHELKIWGENVAIKLYVPQSQLNGNGKKK